jgi:hypothetical protein
MIERDKHRSSRGQASRPSASVFLAPSFLCASVSLWLSYPSKRLNSSAPFVPPKPNEFESA